ncbi:MAG: alcohol dehydrogenase catalytic domain-containing protein, partial [Rhodocyclaceae bacterium]|nr:alcohol dehydrogenase catalytic domain-containing protein [Rhodocyclaceae bacterium]
MTKAIRIHEHGGPEVLKWEDVEVGAPGPDEVRLKTTAAGLNFIDTYHRTGMYKIPLPSVIGREGAGIVEAIGSNVKSCKVGDRVAYASSPMGAYAEARLMPADRVVKIPAAISDQQAASMMLKGMTAQYLLRRTYRVKA